MPRRTQRQAQAQQSLNAPLELQVNGLSGWLCSIQVNEGDRVRKVQERIEAATGIAANCQELLVGTRVLERCEVLGQALQGALEVSVLKSDPQSIRRAEARRTGREALAKARQLMNREKGISGSSGVLQGGKAVECS
eukprot:gb/GFBE01050668.1/.p1 GENE.gb/GFBE01050668.1/~~gb/GFBE01050668.1/.p1  ORF type:complete len:137 (+),score=35.15 gb/GFBE01050668.1/:1-411(+)